MKPLSIVSMVALTLAAAVAHAAPSSVLINRAPARAFIEGKLLNKARTGLNLRNELDAKDIGASKGVSAKAVTKARLTFNGFSNLNYGTVGGNYVVKFGARKWLVTKAVDRDFIEHNSMVPLERFVARDAKSGTVVARGFVSDKKITWTRMKNEHAKNTPAERNAAE